MNTTEVVAIVTGASTLLAGSAGVALTSSLTNRAARRVARREAYERLASAVHSASFRASALRIPLLPGSSFTGVDVDKAFEVVVAATGAVHIRGSNAARDQADVLFEACQTFVNVTNATPAGPTTPELQTTFDAMVKARKDFLNLARREEHSRRLRR